MDPTRHAEWARQLHPLVIHEPIGPQIHRQFLTGVVCSGLVLGILSYIFAIFTGFGRWDIGLGIVIPFALGLACFWLRYLQLRRRVAAYRQSVEAEMAPD